MIEADILKALQTAVNAAIAATTIPGMPIQAVGRTGGPTPQSIDGKFVEYVHIPNNPKGQFWDDSRNYQGNFRIILHWPTNDDGAMPATRYRDEIGGFFTKRKVFRFGQASVQIYDNPNASGSIPNGSELLYPLTLPYRCFSS